MYNDGKETLDADPDNIEFRTLFDRELDTSLDPLSPKIIELAQILHKRYPATTGDFNTPIAPKAGDQAAEMAGNLKDLIRIPQVIYVSPYDRTLATLEAMKDGWPQLGDVKRVIKEEKVREQEHGDVLGYPDWRVYLALHPDQLMTRRLQGKYWYRYPGGESNADGRLRVEQFTDRTKARHTGESVLVVSHHKTILYARANHEEWDAEAFLKMDTRKKRPANASVTIFRATDDESHDGLKLDEEDYNKILYSS